VPRSPFLHAAPPAAALALGGLRWWLQGSRNTWTATSKQFYVADPDLGWRLDDGHRVWLGLEALGVLAAVVLGFVAVALFVRWRERRTGAPMRRLRALGWALSIVPLAVPAWAFASGGRPAGGRDAIPGAEASVGGGGVAGRLDAPAGAYAADPRSTITAHLAAGGDSFDARFPVTGVVTLDPHDLGDPITGALAADAAAVDTGISLRSKHAREDYLRAAEFPRIGFDLGRVEAVHQDAADVVSFRAAGTVHLIGRDHPVVVSGTMRAGDDAASARLGVAARPLLVQADFTLRVRDTALAADAGDFDRDDLPVHVSLVLVPHVSDKVSR
jgi:polyisoprenoid-binding protein YceI